MELSPDFGSDLNDKMTADGVLDVTIKSSLKKISTEDAWPLAQKEAEDILGCKLPDGCGADHVAFLMDKLQENGFMVRYTHPNLLFISWNHWVPSYVRSEIKKKTGVNVDGYGNILEQKQDKQESENNGLNPFQFANTKNEKAAKEKEKENYKSIRTYKPSGNLIYNNDVLNPFKNNDT